MRLCWAHLRSPAVNGVHRWEHYFVDGRRLTARADYGKCLKIGQEKNCPQMSQRDADSEI